MPTTSTQPAHRRDWSGLAAARDPGAQIGILGVPFDGAVSFRKGAAQAPARIRALTHYMPPITEEGHALDGLTICDYGDVERDLNWERYFGTVAERALSALDHPFTLFLGGDHSVGIPLMGAFSSKFDGPFGVLHIDAHTDLIDIYEGHPWSHACTERRALELPNLAPQHLVFCGIRSWEGEELRFLADHPEITVHTARAMHQDGVEATAQRVIARLSGLDRVYLTLDIDSLDPAYAPGTGTPEAGGLTTRALLEFLRLIFAGLPVRAMDVVEVAPPLDHCDITSFAAMKLIYEVFGWVHRRGAP
jgi:agmatinase